MQTINKKEEYENVTENYKNGKLAMSITVLNKLKSVPTWEERQEDTPHKRVHFQVGGPTHHTKQG